MQARRTPSPFPSLRTFTFCKTSLLKPGYGVEISLSNPSFLAAHKDQTISPLFSKIFFLITMDFSISGNKNFKCMIVIKMKMFLWFWLGSLALIPFWDGKRKSHFAFTPKEATKYQFCHLSPHEWRHCSPFCIPERFIQRRIAHLP